MGKILEQIPTNREGRPTLVACALVATWWTGPSQRRLFSSVEVHEGNYQRWMNGVIISGPEAHLLEHVRSLRHFRSPDAATTRYQMSDLAQDSGEYLSALRNLHSLEFYDTRVQHISEESFRTCFTAFRETLTYLFLNVFTTSFSAFATLVGHFTNLVTLRLGSFTLEPDGGPVPSLSRPLRGQFRVRQDQPDCLEFFN